MRRSPSRQSRGDSATRLGSPDQGSSDYLFGLDFRSVGSSGASTASADVSAPTPSKSDSGSSAAEESSCTCADGSAPFGEDLPHIALLVQPTYGWTSDPSARLIGHRIMMAEQRLGGSAVPKTSPGTQLDDDMVGPDVSQFRRDYAVAFEISEALIGSVYVEVLESLSGEGEFAICSFGDKALVSSALTANTTVDFTTDMLKAPASSVTEPDTPTIIDWAGTIAGASPGNVSHFSPMSQAMGSGAQPGFLAFQSVSGYEWNIDPFKEKRLMIGSWTPLNQLGRRLVRKTNQKALFEERAAEKGKTDAPDTKQLLRTFDAIDDDLIKEIKKAEA